MAEPTSLPGWLKIANPIFMTLIRVGLPVGTQHGQAAPRLAVFRVEPLPLAPVSQIDAAAQPG